MEESGTVDASVPSPSGALVADSEALILRAEEQLHAVEAAIGALEAGSYGRCELCDEPIAADRLQARAWERRCAAHAATIPAESRLF
jgi:RNA polymerase-binding transcription factor DksA